MANPLGEESHSPDEPLMSTRVRDKGAKAPGVSIMESLREVFEDWTIIDTPKRLRGAMLHAARICRRKGKTQDAADFEKFGNTIPASMTEEAIKATLMGIALDFGLFE